LKIWKDYKEKHPCEYEVLDASINHSVETFAPWIENWMSRFSKSRFRVLLILHAEFLTFHVNKFYAGYWNKGLLNVVYGFM